jgi:hypothetical protein
MLMLMDDAVRGRTSRMAESRRNGVMRTALRLGHTLLSVATRVLTGPEPVARRRYAGAADLL